MFVVMQPVVFAVCKQRGSRQVAAVDVAIAPVVLVQPAAFDQFKSDSS